MDTPLGTGLALDPNLGLPVLFILALAFLLVLAGKDDDHYV